MRVPISGGPPQLVMEPKNDASLSCPSPPSAECVLCELTADHKQDVVSSFDPVRGRGHELFRISHDANTPINGMLAVGASLSPDGSLFAILKTDPHEGHIRILSLSGKVEREIEVKGSDQPRLGRVGRRREITVPLQHRTLGSRAAAR